MKDDNTLYAVEQCDRDAAVAYLDGIERRNGTGVHVFDVLPCADGSPHPLAAAFAKHRLTHQPDRAAVEEMRDAVLPLLQFHQTGGHEGDGGDERVSLILAALANLERAK